MNRKELLSIAAWLARRGNCLHRRAQRAEAALQRSSGLLLRRGARSGGSFGRMLAWRRAEVLERELAEALGRCGHCRPSSQCAGCRRAAAHLTRQRAKNT